MVVTWAGRHTQVHLAPSGADRWVGPGLVRPGLAADLVVFDPATVSDVGTYEDPCRAPRGIPYVIVNGQQVIAGGTHTGARSGYSLRSTRICSG